MSILTSPKRALLEKGDPTRTAAVTIVDDDAHTLFFVRLIINEAMPQAEVVCFNSPRRAFEYISRIGSDLLITDHGMGEMSGTDLIMQLRAEALSLSVIMISNDTSTRAEALAAGACEFLSKEELNKLPALISSRLAQVQVASQTDSQNVPELFELGSLL